MASREKNAYFIIMAQPMSSRWIHAGSICYMNEKQYSTPKPQKEVSVICIGSSVHYDLPLDILQPLTRQKTEFLLALESHKERLDEFVHGEALDQAVELTVGSEVTVEQKGEWLKGVVRYIGPLSELRLLDPIAGVFFGVELQVSCSLFCVRSEGNKIH